MIKKIYNRISNTTISVKRHIAKTISYRIISTGVGFIVLYGSTGNIKVGAAFSAFEIAVKPFIYFLHERGWYKYIKFGVKNKIVKEEIKTETSLTETE